jgi:hypothetical protein
LRTGRARDGDAVTATAAGSGGFQTAPDVAVTVREPYHFQSLALIDRAPVVTPQAAFAIQRFSGGLH